MKILHFIPLLVKGGAERVVVDLANEAIAEGHEVTVVTWRPTPAELLRCRLHTAVKLRHLSERTWRSGDSTAQAYTTLFPWVIRSRHWLLDQDVIHCHLSLGSAFATAIQLLRWTARRRTPAIVETYHAVGVAIPKLSREVHARLLARRDAVAFMAEDAYWTRYRAAHHQPLFRTIPNGVSFADGIDAAASERYRREQARIPTGALVIGSVGRLVPERRPELLLETFRHLRDLVRSDIHLLLAGEGPLRPHLEAQAKRTGLADRVHMPGLILNPQDAFGVIDVYLTLNVGSTTGVAALEAAGAGVPVVAVQLDRTYRLKDDDWIWSSSRPREVAERIASLLDGPAELKSLSVSQCRFVRENFSVKAMAKAYQHLYSEAVAARASASSR